MKHIGVVGVSAEGAALCYRIICMEAAKRLGKFMHPEITMHTRSFDQILKAQEERNWNKVAGFLLDSLRKLGTTGADFAIIPGNSVHYSFPTVLEKSPIPVISIVDTVADECMKRGYKKAAVLGVGFTMQGGLYSEPLKERGIEYVTPTAQDQEHISRIIYEEIVPGTVSDESLKKLLRILEKLRNDDCDVAILACTELPIVITNENAPLPILDSTRLLAVKAVDEALL